jgi:hypothetical protein
MFRQHTIPDTKLCLCIEANLLQVPLDIFPRPEGQGRASVKSNSREHFQPGLDALEAVEASRHGPDRREGGAAGELLFGISVPDELAPRTQSLRLQSARCWCEL